MARALRWGAAAAIAGAIAAGAACGSKSPAAPDPPPVQTTTITITSAGTNPKNIEITQGSRVRFINNDTRSHWMASDPHPDHNDCPEMDLIGTLQPGQQRETGNFVTIRTCGYHDHDLPNITSLQGNIVIRP
jgi:plastocyanin